MRILVLLFLLFQVSGIYSQSYSRIRVFLQDDFELKKLGETGVAIDHIVHRRGAFAELEVSDRELSAIKEAGFETEMLIEDVSEYYRQRNLKPAPQLSATTDCEDPADKIITPLNFSYGSMGGYYTYQEMLDQLDSMASKYPTLISSRQTVGTYLTFENRPLYWVRISDNPTIDENEPEVFYNAVHHAREPASMSQLIFYMWYLLENYASDSSVIALLNNTEMYFIPCINPDGYIFNETISPNGGGMWRKNRRAHGDGEYGVDLNRNYGHYWGFDNSGSSPNTANATYRGPSAFSEPETQAIKYFCENHDFKLTLNYHTYGDLLIYPWGYQPSIYTPDSALFVNYAELLTNDNHYQFGTGDQTVGYVTNGDSDDWMYGEQTTKNKTMSMTPEAGLSSDGFWPATSRIENICKVNVTQNLNMAKLALRYAWVKEESPSVFNQTSGFIRFNITNLGLDTPSAFTVTLTPLLNVSTAGNPKSFSGMTLREVRNDSISFSLPAGLTSGQTFSFVLETDNGLWKERDTIIKQFGTGTIAYSDSGNQMTGWQSNIWNTTFATYYSSPSSITDSPSGNYTNNSTREITLANPIDLSNVTTAALRFMARWDIELGYDYVQVLASAGGTSWTPLCGRYTKKGTPDQAQGEPLFDGVQNTWVEENMSLNDFTGNSQVYIKFRLRSDAWVTGDGFYFDNLTIETTETNSIKEEGKVRLHMWPNPASDAFYVSGLNHGEELRIFDRTGRKIKSLIIGSGTTKVSIEDLAPGIYIVSSGNKTGRLVKFD